LSGGVEKSFDGFAPTMAQDEKFEKNCIPEISKKYLLLES
jgi:hypothetical protein